MTRLGGVTKHEDIAWRAHSDYKPLTLLIDAEIILLENNTCLGIRIYNKQIYNLLIILVVSLKSLTSHLGFYKAKCHF